jgi:hypothetical protein
VTYIRKVLIVGVIAAGAVVLYFFDPEKTIWLPKCPFHLLTGYQCPSCGTQRSIFHLLHFDLYTALHYNFFAIISIPYAITLVVATWFNPKGKLDNIKRFCYSNITIYTYVILVVLWWVVRNVVGV